MFESSSTVALRGCKINRVHGGLVEIVEASRANRRFPDRVTESLGVCLKHLLGAIDVTVTGSVAAAECHVRAWHHAKGCPGGDEWVVGGHYVFALAQTGETWKITEMNLHVFQQTGNTMLLQEAEKS